MAWLINLTQNNLVPAYFLIATSIIGLVVVTFWFTDTSGKSLRGSPPAVEEKHEIRELLKEPEEALWWHEEHAMIQESASHPEHKK